MNRPDSTRTFDLIISTVLAVAAVLLAFALAGAFQTIPTASAPFLQEQTYVR